MLPAIGHSGGIDVIYKYTEFFVKNGHDVIIYKSIKAPNMHRYTSEIQNKVHQLYCSIKAIKSLKNKHIYDKFVFSSNNKSIRNADVIIATAWPTAYEVAQLDECKGKKYYFIQDFEIWDNPALGLGSYKLPLNKIVISSWINTQLKTSLEIGPFPIVPNGIDIEKYHNKNKKNITAQKGISFLMLNHTLKKKGIENGIKAFEQVRKSYPNAKLRAFGTCSGKNLPKYVEYFQNPSQRTIVDLYCKSDIFIFPSIEEGWGLTPLEAMACYCAVVGTKTGFVLDLGRHEQNMMISEPGDINGMVENILSLIQDNNLYKKICLNGYQTVKGLSWNCSYQKLYSLLSNRG